MVEKRVIFPSSLIHIYEGSPRNCAQVSLSTLDMDLQALAREKLAQMREEMAVREATEKELRRAIRLAGVGSIYTFFGEAYAWGLVYGFNKTAQKTIWWYCGNKFECS